MTRSERKIYKKAWCLKNKAKVSEYNANYRNDNKELNELLKLKYAK